MRRVPFLASWPPHEPEPCMVACAALPALRPSTFRPLAQSSAREKVHAASLNLDCAPAPESAQTTLSQPKGRSTRAHAAGRHGTRTGHASHAFRVRGKHDRARDPTPHASRCRVGARRRCTCTVYVCDVRLGLLKPMLGAIVLHHLRTTPLIGAAHRAQDSRATCRVNNLPRTRHATSLRCRRPPAPAHSKRN